MTTTKYSERKNTREKAINEKIILHTHGMFSCIFAFIERLRYGMDNVPH